MTIPYTYLLHHIPTNKFYYGVRHKNNCTPEDFWKTYFTSSKEVKKLIEIYSKDSFEYEIRKTFQTKEEAINWEHKVLSKLNLKSDKWLNKHNGKSIIMTEKVKENISKSLIGKTSGKKNGMFGKKREDLSTYNKLETTIEKRRLQLKNNNPMFDKEIVKIAMNNRRSFKGKNNPNYGKIGAARSKKWYHDSINKIEKYYIPGEQPLTYLLGRLK